MKNKINVININIDKLKHPHYNPRHIDNDDFEQLKKSLNGFNVVQPANPKRQNIIIGGNQRIKAAVSLGWKTFPCIRVSLDEELNLQLNRNTGVFDYNILGEHFNFDELEQYGFNDKDLETVKEMMDLNSSDYNDTSTSERTYCPVWRHIDIGRSFCQHACLYCYTKTPPANIAKKQENSY